MDGGEEWEQEDTGDWVESVVGNMEPLEGAPSVSADFSGVLLDHRGQPFPRREAPEQAKIPIGFALPPKSSS